MRPPEYQLQAPFLRLLPECVERLELIGKSNKSIKDTSQQQDLEMKLAYKEYVEMSYMKLVIIIDILANKKITFSPKCKKNDFYNQEQEIWIRLLFERYQ